MHETRRILVVEDDSQIAEIICWNLRAAGYLVTVVADGLEAMQAFDREHPALVTVDLMIPSVSGFRLVAVFKHERPEVPVLVVTALTFEEAEETARAGADDFITKPFDPGILVQKIDYHFHRAPVPPVVGGDSPADREPPRARREPKRDLAVA